MAVAGPEAPTPAASVPDLAADARPRSRGRTSRRGRAPRRGCRPSPSPHSRSRGSRASAQAAGSSRRKARSRAAPATAARTAAVIPARGRSKASMIARRENRKMPLFQRCWPPATIAAAVAASGFSTKRASGRARAPRPGRARRELEIAVAGLGARRAHAEGDELAGRRRRGAVRATRAEGRRIGDRVVGGADQHQPPPDRSRRASAPRPAPPARCCARRARSARAGAACRCRRAAR